MVVSRLADSPQRIQVAGVVTLLEEPMRRATILRLPRVPQEWTIVERQVLTCVAVHHWNHGGSISYRPPTAHQARVACWLAGPDLRLLCRVGGRRPSFRLSRLGEVIAQRALRLVPAVADMAREREFDRMRALMRNEWETIDWETHEVADDEGAS